MKTTCLILAAAAISASAQTPPNAGIVYQQAGVITAQAAPGGAGMIVLSAPGAMMTPVPVAGSPFSAVEQTHSLQMLGDGTRIERSESQQVYRDSMGRTRVESGAAGTGSVTIQDPVEGFRLVLNAAERTAQKMPAPKTYFVGRFEPDALKALTPGGPQVNGFAYSFIEGNGRGTEQAPSSREKVENLPPQNINGVLATGRRVSRTIAAGEIGNDRPIQMVSDSWYSNDLQMVVKSSSSDPRFGESSFELTNIVRAEPDPGLFQIPAGYTVTDGRAIKTKVRIRE
jgi:hypothetical protein